VNIVRNERGTFAYVTVTRRYLVIVAGTATNLGAPVQIQAN
jgi:hypothetical protein